MRKPGKYAKRLVLLVWILVAIFYFYLSYDYIRISMNDEKLGEYVQYVANLAGNDNRPAKEIRTLIVLRAEELNLPLRAEQISIVGGGHALSISVGYDVDIEVPVLRQGFYVKHYSHKKSYKTID